jgi:hypothetical protein
MTTKVAHSQGSLSRNVPTGHTVDFTTHTHQPFIYSSKYCWQHITKLWTWTQNLFFHSVFRCWLYSILHFSFFFIQSVFCCPPPPPNFSALGTCLVCPVVKLAVSGTSSYIFRPPAITDLGAPYPIIKLNWSCLSSVLPPFLYSSLHPTFPFPLNIAKVQHSTCFWISHCFSKKSC